MILLLGANGYIGQAFANALRRRENRFIPLSRETLDYTRFEFLFDYLRKIKPEFLINAVDFIDLSNGTGAETDRMGMLQANAVLPQIVSRACGMTNTPWAQISSGSIYSGAKVLDREKVRVERDLTRPGVRALFELRPEVFVGFTETDEPNCSFRFAPCSFYSGTKALAEESIRNQTQNYIWRLRLPFNTQDEPDNFLSRLQDCSNICRGINSLSHLDECVGACLELWERRAAFGIYNMTNPGAISTEEIIQMVQRILKPERSLELCVDELNGFGSTPRWPESNCILDTSKLRRTGVKLCAVGEALEKTLLKWRRRTAGLTSSRLEGLSAYELL